MPEWIEMRKVCWGSGKWNRKEKGELEKDSLDGCQTAVTLTQSPVSPIPRGLFQSPHTFHASLRRHIFLANRFYVLVCSATIDTLPKSFDRAYIVCGIQQLRDYCQEKPINNQVYRCHNHAYLRKIYECQTRLGIFFRVLNDDHVACRAKNKQVSGNCAPCCQSH